MKLSEKILLAKSGYTKKEIQQMEKEDEKAENDGQNEKEDIRDSGDSISDIEHINECDEDSGSNPGANRKNEELVLISELQKSIEDLKEKNENLKNENTSMSNKLKDFQLKNRNKDLTNKLQKNELTDEQIVQNAIQNFM